MSDSNPDGDSPTAPAAASSAATARAPRIAVLVPCYNEAITVAKVVRDFKAALPTDGTAEVYVYDNNSKDDTAKLAAEAGAVVRRESRQGKGYVVQAMFREIDADIYVMVDGDDTYPAEELHKLLAPVLEGRCDIVIGTRLEQATDVSLNPLHQLGNRGFVFAFNLLFGCRVKDLFSGYMVMTRRFVKSIPLRSTGFEVETEINAFAITRGLKMLPVPITYRERPEGSESKLNTFRDGFRILRAMLEQLKHRKPGRFYAPWVLTCFLLGTTGCVLPFVDGVFTTERGAMLSLALGATFLVSAAVFKAVIAILDAGVRRQRELDSVVEKAGHVTAGEIFQPPPRPPAPPTG